jgi:hypothetical protein
VEAELQRGFDNLIESEYMFSDEEVQRVKGSNLAYKRAWLRNLQARHERADKGREGERTIQLMRNNMQCFLQLI